MKELTPLPNQESKSAPVPATAAPLDAKVVANAITKAAQTIIDIALENAMRVPQRGTLEMVIRDFVVTPLLTATPAQPEAEVPLKCAWCRAPQHEGNCNMNDVSPG